MRRNVARRKSLEPEKYLVKFRIFEAKKEFLIKEKLEKSAKRKEFLKKYNMEVEEDMVLSEVDLSIALDDLFKRAANEVEAIHDKKTIEKIAIKEGEVLWSKNRKEWS